MNIVHLIGNGFDLNLDLETSYPNFYEYYKKLPSKGEVIKALKEDITEKYKNWSDLEKRLGEYSINFKTSGQFDVAFIDIVTNLSKYLIEQEKKLELENIDSQKLFDYLAYPEKLLLPTEVTEIKSFKKTFGNNQRNINLITFNYTRTLELIADFKGQQKEISKFGPVINMLQDIKHVHGYVDKGMILGVNDISQIANNSFHSNKNVLNLLVKSNCNKVKRQNIDNACKNLIIKADLICIFGSSFGITDKLWWELVGERLKQNCKLIIFVLGKEVPAVLDYMIDRQESDFKDAFLAKTKLEKKEIEKVANKIYICINSEMFNLKKEQKMSIPVT